MKLNGGIGLRLLGVWLILSGLLPFLNVRIPNSATILAILAIVAGVLIVLDR